MSTKLSLGMSFLLFLSHCYVLFKPLFQRVSYFENAFQIELSFVDASLMLCILVKLLASYIMMIWSQRVLYFENVYMKEFNVTCFTFLICDHYDDSDMVHDLIASLVKLMVELIFKYLMTIN